MSGAREERVIEQPSGKKQLFHLGSKARWRPLARFFGLRLIYLPAFFRLTRARCREGPLDRVAGSGEIAPALRNDNVAPFAWWVVGRPDADRCVRAVAASEARPERRLIGELVRRQRIKFWREQLRVTGRHAKDKQGADVAEHGGADAIAQALGELRRQAQGRCELARLGEQRREGIRRNDCTSSACTMKGGRSAGGSAARASAAR